MYLDFYKLHTKPFQISTDPRFLWLGEKHKEALAVLKYGILDNKGFLLLTGDVGTGKTTLLNALIASLGDEVLVAMVTDPGLAKMDFFNFVADSFEMDKRFQSKGEFLIYLKNFLLDIHRQNKQALLIIDECQHLNQKLLEEVRLLSNIEKYNTKLINIFFVGQSEFNEIILRPRNRAIRQRITINYNISALAESETDQYIRFRLMVAGSKDAIFTSKAISEIYRFSNGYPRLINIICDQALLTGYVKEKRKIDHKIVSECAEELKIPYGMSLKKSMATPETANAKPVDVVAVDINEEPNIKNKSRQFSRPLVVAFFVVVFIWIGLVTTFFLNRQKKSAPTVAPIKDSQLQVPLQDNQARPKVKPNVADSNQVKEETQMGSTSVSVGTDSGSSKMPASTVPLTPHASRPQANDGAESAGRTPSSFKTTGDAPAESRLSLNDIQNTFGIYPEIQFDFNSNTLTAESYDMLGLIARYCLQHPETKMVLWGYTDRSGVRAYNLKLAEFRADMVKTYLVGRGIRAAAITTLAIGPDPQGPGGKNVPYDGSRRKVVIEIMPND